MLKTAPEKIVPKKPKRSAAVKKLDKSTSNKGGRGGKKIRWAELSKLELGGLEQGRILTAQGWKLRIQGGAKR